MSISTESPAAAQAASSSLFSILSTVAADASSLADLLSPTLAAYDYRTELYERDGAEKVDICLPGRPPLTTPRHKSGKVFHRENRPIGSLEPAATAVMDAIMDRVPMDSFLDIGASNGYFGFLAATHPAPPGGAPIAAHCFEMSDLQFGRMQALAAEHGVENLHAHLSGMSDAPRGEKQIWYSVTKMFESEPPPRAYRDNIFIRIKFLLRGRVNRDVLRTAMVRIDSIDAFVERHGIAPGIVKIDVDGYEVKVVPGGMETFARHRPVLFLELHRYRMLAPQGGDRRSVVDPLFDLGYRALLIDNHRDLPTARLRAVEPDDPAFAKDATELFIFV
ncbi:MAG: FkbM family methyltransferase [Pseudomonadota bacterium]